MNLDHDINAEDYDPNYDPNDDDLPDYWAERDVRDS
jgi:hypothetical protein